jgi:hypothetical protein
LNVGVIPVLRQERAAMNKRRIALHEAGHLVMAFIIGLDVLGCDISRGADRRPGELGRCVVFDPDPVGFRKFLLAMAGVMAENAFLGDDRGGIKDRYDAYDNLYRYLSHYNRLPRYDLLKPLLGEVSDVFYSKPCLETIEKAAGIMQSSSSLSRKDIVKLRQDLEDRIELGHIRKRVDSLAGEHDPFSIRSSLGWLFDQAVGLVKKIRKM